MTPFRFIKLHEKDRCDEVLVNVEQIIFIRDMRSDPAVQKNEGFHWTAIGMTRYAIKVLETEEEIVAKIAMLQ